MTDTLIKDAQSFLRTLTQNNTKDWWEDNKATYTEKLKTPALALLDALTPQLADVCGDPVKPKLFRPHRDVRFSKDKTPYKTYLHMLWTPQTGGRADPAYFFGINTDSVTIGTGMMGFDKDVLADWRKMVDLDGKRISGIVDDLKAQGFDHWGDPPLKRVPKPWDADHPHADLLRRKTCVMTRPLTEYGPLQDTLMDAFKTANPLTKMLTGIAFG